MKTYSLSIEQIPSVQGSFEYLGEENGKAYVRSKTKLKEPFIEEELPQSLQDTLNAPLKEAKEAKIAELNAKCDSLLQEFSSSALGAEHIYDGSIEDQINLMGALNLGVDMPFRCRKPHSGSKENILHTKEQLAQVFSDGASYKANIINQCGALKSYVEGLSDIATIEQVSWESYKDIAKEVTQ
ncbi:hypothetical protein [uncultured Helicobacter sp.]|uniref:DUF4376 domain-containing protein n=1 Tax=uncultured Helicobacter sp. TaxID=175537 RepID=UPI00374F6842